MKVGYIWLHHLLEGLRQLHVSLVSLGRALDATHRGADKKKQDAEMERSVDLLAATGARTWNLESPWLSRVQLAPGADV